MSNMGVCDELKAEDRGRKTVVGREVLIGACTTHRAVEFHSGIEGGQWLMCPHDKPSHKPASATHEPPPMGDASRISGVLPDKEIKRRLGRDLIIHPLLHESQVHICKVDLRLDTVFYEVQSSALAAYDQLFQPLPGYRRRVELPPGVPYFLHPNQLALAPTYEHVSLPNDLLGRLQGRSSLARLGVVVHATAGFVDPGFSGPLTLELSNLGDLPVKLYPLSRVAAIAFLTLTELPLKSYAEPEPSPMAPGQSLSPKYSGPVSHPSRYEQDWENEVLKALAENAQ